MKKTRLLLILSLCLCICACNKNNISHKTNTSSHTSKVIKETETKQSREPITRLDCISDEYQIVNTISGAGSTLIFEISKANDGNHKLIYVDVENDVIIDTLSLGHNDEAIGITKDGSIVTINYGSNCFEKITKDNRTLLGAFEGFGYVYDADNEYIYMWNDKDLSRIDMTGRLDNIKHFAHDMNIKGYDPKYNYAYVICDSINEVTASDYAIYSIDNDSKLYSIPLGTTGSFIRSQEGFFLYDNYLVDDADTEDNLRYSISYISYSNFKYKGGYEFANHVQTIFIENSSYIFATEFEGDLGNSYANYAVLLNTKTGEASDFTELVKGCDYCLCNYVKDSNLFILTSVNTNNKAQNVYALYPSKYANKEQLQRFIVEKKQPEIYTLGSELSDIKSKANEIEEKYNVTIQIGNEIKNIVKNDAYDFISTEESTYMYGIEEYKEMYRNGLLMLDDVLSTYPAGYFDKFKNSDNEGGIRIAIVSHINKIESDFVPAGLSFKYGAWYNIVININAITNSSTIQHELWHACEQRIIAEYPDVFSPYVWNALNPDDFTYQGNYDNYEHTENIDKYLLTDSPDAYFVELYSTVTAEEDRATLVEFLYHITPATSSKELKANYEFIKNYPSLYKKLQYLEENAKKVWGYVYWLEL